MRAEVIAVGSEILAGHTPDTNFGVIASHLAREGIALSRHTVVPDEREALGLVLASFITWVRFDLMSLLFGNLLAVSLSDLYWIYGGGAVCLGIVIGMWRPLVLVSIGEDIAVAEGVRVNRVRFVFMVLIAFVVALAMKIVGVMLITALLIIPAAAVRCFSKSPEMMAGLAAIAGLLSVGAGMLASVNADTPPGPSIVLAAGILFVLSLLWRALVPAIPPAGKGR